MPDVKYDKDGNIIKEENANEKANEEELSDDDYFEKLLSENGGVDGDDGTGSNKKEEGPTRAELEAENAKLKKAAAGQLTDTVKSRQERSAMKTELVELRGAVTQLFNKRDSLNGEEKKPTPKPLEDPKKKIEFEADESAFVDLGEVKTALQENKDNTQEQIDELKRLQADQAQKSDYERTVSGILDTNRAEFDPAYQKLQEAVKSLNDKVIEVQTRTDTPGDPKTGELTVDAALDLLDGSEEEEAFKKDYPGLNPTQIARAFNSKRDLKDTLTQIATTLKPDGTKPATDSADMDLIRRARSKPGSLSGQDNQSGAGETLLDKITNLPTESIMDISDAEADRIEKMMRDEELRGE